MAKLGGEEERRKEIVRRFHSFNDLPHAQRSFDKFKSQLLDYVQSPSDHCITVQLDGDDHIMDCVSYEHGSAAMRQLVTHCILEKLIQASEDRKKLTTKKKRRKGRVGQVCIENSTCIGLGAIRFLIHFIIFFYQVRKGSDGF